MIQPTQVFLDANIYFAAFAFKAGLSSVIFSLARKGQILISTIPLVLKEADRNLKEAGPEPRNAFHRFLNEVKIQMLPDPPSKEVQKYREWLSPQDALVWAGVLSSKVFIFLTLDRKNFLDRNLLPGKESLQIKTPLQILRD